MQAASSETLKNQVYDALFSDIINGVYSFGTILTEKFLMEKYQVSRAPIREALSQLTGTNLLSSIPRQGYTITMPNRKQLLEVVKFRSALECSFLQNYSSYIDQNCIKALRDSCTAYSNCLEGDSVARWRCNREFHLKLFSIYRNTYAYKHLENALHFQTVFFVQNSYRPTVDLHVAVTDYLEKGEISTAVALLKSDIENLLIPIIDTADEE